MRVSVIGAGGWGTTLALILNERNNDVTLWEYFADYCRVLKKKRENIKFLKGIRIPARINITNDVKESIENSEVIVLAVPSHVLRGLLKKIKKFKYRKKTYISVVK